jgi:hypothetical protein
MEDLLDWRFLGISTLKSSTFGIDEVSFFELSEPWKKQQDQPVKGESSTPSIATNSEDSLMMGSGQSTTTTRVRNITAEHSSRTVVMSLDTQVFKPSKRQVYYLFPSDAIVEKMSETPPYEVSTNLKSRSMGSSLSIFFLLLLCRTSISYSARSMHSTLSRNNKAMVWLNTPVAPPWTGNNVTQTSRHRPYYRTLQRLTSKCNTR